DRIGSVLVEEAVSVPGHGRRGGPRAGAGVGGRTGRLSLERLLLWRCDGPFLVLDLSGRFAALDPSGRTRAHPLVRGAFPARSSDTGPGGPRRPDSARASDSLLLPTPPGR